MITTMPPGSKPALISSFRAPLPTAIQVEIAVRLHGQKPARFCYRAVRKLFANSEFSPQAARDGDAGMELRVSNINDEPTFDGSRDRVTGISRCCPARPAPPCLPASGLEPGGRS